MALPKIKQPEYTHFLYGINKEVKFRPFTNAEQKILLLAKEESKDNKNRIIESIQQILRNCIIDDINVDELPIFDIEDLFMRIRAKSVGEVIQIRFSYDYTDETGATKTDFVKKEVNIDDIKLNKGDDTISRDVIVDKANNIGIRMKYPTFGDMKNQDLVSSINNKNNFDTIKSSIEFIYDENDIYHISDYTDEEIDSFIDDIGVYGMEKIKEFFDNMPTLKHKIEITLPKLNNKKETITLKGIKDFFT